MIYCMIPSTRIAMVTWPIARLSMRVVQRSIRMGWCGNRAPLPPEIDTQQESSTGIVPVEPFFIGEESLQAIRNFLLTSPLDSVVWYRVYSLLVSMEEKMNSLSIGQVARRAGVGIETVRFYEREGLLEEPPRRVSGYRQYSEQVVTRLHFIKSAQKLGFSLKEISELLLLRVDART